MATTEKEIRALILRIVTGDGEQSENLTMSEEEMKESITDPRGSVDITMDADDWLQLVRIAKEECE